MNRELEKFTKNIVETKQKIEKMLGPVSNEDTPSEEGRPDYPIEIDSKAPFDKVEALVAMLDKRFNGVLEYKEELSKLRRELKFQESENEKKKNKIMILESEIKENLLLSRKSNRALEEKLAIKEDLLKEEAEKVSPLKRAYTSLTFKMDSLEEDVEGRFLNQIQTLNLQVEKLRRQILDFEKKKKAYEAQLVTARKKAGKVDVQAIDIANLTRKNGALTAQLQTQHKEVAKLERKLKDAVKVDEARLSVEREARERLQIKVDERSKYISQIEDELKDTQAIILELRESTSWKVSAPVRWLGKLRS